MKSLSTKAFLRLSMEMFLVMCYTQRNEEVFPLPAIVKQTDKRTGITYVYESVSHWDKEKQQSRAKRTLLGRLDPETGEIVPTKKRQDNQSAKQPLQKPGPTPALEVSRSFCGATHLLDQIGATTGLMEDLKRCFPDRFSKILSVAYYLILENEAPLMRFPKWARFHRHPYGENLSSQRSSELFASITEEERYQFFRLQAMRRAESEFWCYDTTSISSYSEQLLQARYGKNKEDDRLPQINLALVFGHDSHLPFYYRKLPGNISDVTTVKRLLEEMEFLQLRKVKLVMDRGFYSEANVNALYKDHYKFILAAKTSLKFVRQALDTIRPTIKHWKKYDASSELYMHSETIEWAYSQARPYKGDTLKDTRRLYLHVYYNSERAVDEERRLNQLVTNLAVELQESRRTPEHERLYEKYFTVTHTPKRGIRVKPNEKAIDEAKQNHGFFVLLSNATKDPKEALLIYRNKDLTEKAFGNLKERLNMRRMLVSSDASLDGKLFVQFIALIFLSFLKKRMQDQELFGKYTIQGLLDELDVIECYHYPGAKPRYSEITKRQKELYERLGAKPPASLQ